MRYKKKYPVLSFLLIFGIAGSATSPDISSSNWAADAKPSVIEMGFDKISVAGFIELLVDASGGGRGRKINGVIELDRQLLDDAAVKNIRQELHNAGIETTRIGDFCWIDLDADGVYELIASVDYSGRAFFNNLYIVKQRGPVYAYQNISAYNIERTDGAMEDLEKGWRGSMTLCYKGCKLVINDLDNDGHIELVIPQGLTEYRGARPMAVWPAIYKWNGQKFQEASEQFKDFYRAVLLPNVDARIREIEEEMRKSPSEWDALRNRDGPEMIAFYKDELEERLAVKWIIRDKIFRSLGDDPLAGLERAKQWAKSPNVNMRENAVVVFGELKSVESLSFLEFLSQDSDPFVAQQAQQTLERIKNKPH